MSELNEKMQKTVDSFKLHIATLRTNRANPDMLSGVVVEYYGSKVPLQQLASVSAPEATTLVLNVFDQGAIKSIEKAIQTSQLGLNPNTDGGMIRIRLPELTEERRKELVKVLHAYAEEGKVALRNVRRDAIDKIKVSEKAKELTEDESKKMQEEVQASTESFSKKIDELVLKKEKEILTV